MCAILQLVYTKSYIWDFGEFRWSGPLILIANHFTHIQILKKDSKYALNFQNLALTDLGCINKPLSYGQINRPDILKLWSNIIKTFNFENCFYIIKIVLFLTKSK